MKTHGGNWKGRYRRSRFASAMWRTSQAALFAGAIVGSLVNLRALRTGGIILIAAATAEAGQPQGQISFAGNSLNGGALSNGSIQRCESQASQFGDGSGSGDPIATSCLQAFYLKANPTAVRTNPDLSLFAYGFSNLLFVRSPQVTLVPVPGSPGVRTRVVNTGKLSDVVTAGSFTRLQEVQALALDWQNDEVIVLDGDGTVLTYPIGVGGNLAPLRSFTPANADGINSVAYEPGTDELVVVRPGTARLDFYSRRADVDGHQPWSATGIVRSLSGSQTAMVSPADAAVAPDTNELFVLDRGGNQILVYDAGASGDVAPKRTISGALTRLSTPQAISYIESSHQLQIWNGDGNSLVFPAGASGDVTPQ